MTESATTTSEDVQSHTQDTPDAELGKKLDKLIELQEAYKKDQEKTKETESTEESKQATADSIEQEKQEEIRKLDQESEAAYRNEVLTRLDTIKDSDDPEFRQEVLTAIDEVSRADNSEQLIAAVDRLDQKVDKFVVAMDKAQPYVEKADTTMNVIGFAFLVVLPIYFVIRWLYWQLNIFH